MELQRLRGRVDKKIRKGTFVRGAKLGLTEDIRKNYGERETRSHMEGGCTGNQYNFGIP